MPPATPSATPPDAPQACSRSRRDSAAAAVAARFQLDLRSLAAFRVAIGSIVAADALLRCRDFSLMFTPDGMFPHDVLRSFQPTPVAWSLAFLVDATWWDAAVLGLEGLAGILLTIGFQTRLATMVAWVAVVSVIRRTAPATNAGDLWLATLLFWGIFLPLGVCWSLDGIRKHRADSGRGGSANRRTCDGHVSIASVALTLQVLVVYVTAGLAKCNDTWLSGTAVQTALSVHDHGTPLGAWLASIPWLPRLAGVAIILLELGGPVLFIAAASPRLRAFVVTSFVLFHAAVAALMTVGLFAAVGIAAWLPLVPGAVWDAAGRVLGRNPNADSDRAADLPHGGRGWLRPMAQVLCGGCLLLAAADAVARIIAPARQLPATIQLLLDATCLRQSWEMFGTVPDQEQWAYARALLADGSEVDLLRHGRPLQRERPSGGFTSLPHHRWHKLLWELPKPTLRMFSPSIARAIAEHWNRSQPPSRQAHRVEICFARLTGANGTPVELHGVWHELVLATWPPRDSRGGGSLDRWLEEHGDTEAARLGGADEPPVTDAGR
jgi:uncharacterized membrane protein YphA (DoxX/SURF4 family)